MTMNDEYYMRLALEEAEKAAAEDEVPIGALIVKDGEILSCTHNGKERENCAVYHAEILAIMEATKAVSNWWLEDCTLYVTLEPCAMCAGAVVNSRLKRVVYGARDERYGFMGSLANLSEDYPLNHSVEVTGGVLAEPCASILSDFFRKKRKNAGNIKKN